MAQLTPMMQQYVQIKEENPDMLLLYRLGDFYELFFDDANVASRELNLVLTARECGLKEKAPMCGVPVHAVDSYVAQLVSAGHKVAICDQLEDPRQAKGLVKRGITRIVTPGTLADSGYLHENENSYIVSLVPEGELFGISWCDVSTGQFCYRDMLSAEELRTELERLQPREYLVPQSDYRPDRRPANAAMVTPYGDWAFRRQNARKALEKHFAVSSLKSFDIDLITAGVRAAGALIQYLHDSQKNSLAHISRLRSVKAAGHVILDAAAIRNLEIVRTMLTGSRKGSLLGLLDQTRTPAGARLLRNTLLEPLAVKSRIDKRLDAVDRLIQDRQLAEICAAGLDQIRDMERILSKLSYNALTVADCLKLRQALHALPSLKSALLASDNVLLRQLGGQIEELPELRTLLDETIREDASGAATEGGFIKEGYSGELDELVALAEHGADELSAMERRERDRTGIRTLKIKYNRVFGYSIEVGRAAAYKVPADYTRRQTLANSERYVTEELSDLQERLLTAAAKRKELEYEIFLRIKQELEKHVRAFQQTAAALSMLDVLQSFARVSSDNNYVRPELTESGEIEIRDGRHPVVERSISDGFVANDTNLNEATRMLLITGPNMAGKSTYMRQVGLIILMAHVGCFVPASSAKIGIVDRIFTRIGASDDLAAGQSTFMVEMNELASILNNATQNSLLILDEVGRGTSTVDGLAIAEAAAMHILNKIGAKTLFATHYHELIRLGEENEGIKNYSVAVKEFGNSIVFLHKIVEGGTDRSFGIEVARLAGIPEEVLAAARQYLPDAAVQLHRSADSPGAPTVATGGGTADSAVSETLRRIDGINPDTLAPLEALNLIYQLKRALADDQKSGEEL